MNPFRVLGKDIKFESTTWYDKHSPTHLSDIIGNEQSIRNIENYLLTRNIPHLILVGPNGSGKATAIKCLVEGYLGPKGSQLRKEACLEINGAIDRGKDVVSEKTDGKKGDRSAGQPNVISFIKKRITLPPRTSKIIVIYDFDHMTPEAQMALRRIMEKYDNTRFILQCNDGNVIEAIQSRCTPLRFTSLSDEEIGEGLHRIAEKEGLELPDEVTRLICLSANGDLKRGIGYLQVMAHSTQMTADCFYKIFNIPSLESINALIAACIAGENTKGYEVVTRMLKNGYNADDILDVLLKVVLRRIELGPNQTFYIQAISESFLRTETCYSDTHLYALVSKLSQIASSGRYELDI